MNPLMKQIRLNYLLLILFICYNTESTYIQIFVNSITSANGNTRYLFFFHLFKFENNILYERLLACEPINVAIVNSFAVNSFWLKSCLRIFGLSLSF